MNVDVKGLSAFMCYSLVGMGTVPVLAYYICLGLGHADWASYCLFLPILYIPYLIVKANKFDHNPPKKSTKYVVAISVFTIAVIAAFMAYGMNPATIKIKVTDWSLRGCMEYQNFWRDCRSSFGGFSS